MKRVNIETSSYDEETGTSFVIIKTKKGMFMGKARIRQEDKDIESRYVGGEMAYWNAVIKSLKADIQEINRQIKIVEELNMNTKDKVVRSKLKSLNKNKKKIEQDIEDIKKWKTTYLKNRKDFHFFLQDRQEKEEEEGVDELNVSSVGFQIPRTTEE